jgi:hypothetical protein
MIYSSSLIKEYLFETPLMSRIELIKLLQNFTLSGKRFWDIEISVELLILKYSKAGVCTGFHLIGMSVVISGVGFL